MTRLFPEFLLQRFELSGKMSIIHLINDAINDPDNLNLNKNYLNKFYNQGGFVIRILLKFESLTRTFLVIMGLSVSVYTKIKYNYSLICCILWNSLLFFSCYFIISFAFNCILLMFLVSLYFKLAFKQIDDQLLDVIGIYDNLTRFFIKAFKFI